tara:strand:+ start:712 stop:864 length:153 start_codon:yes stop_codon:yes gene_type:complete
MKKRISYANQVGTGMGSGKPHRSIKKARKRKASGGRPVTPPPSRPPSKKP